MEPTVENVRSEISLRSDKYPFWETLQDKEAFCRVFDTAEEAAEYFINWDWYTYPMSRRACKDCGVDIFCIHEYGYMVNRDLWEVANERGGLLCIGCLEFRLGMRLSPTKFDWSLPLTWAKYYKRSHRLMLRLQLTVPLQNELHSLYPEDQWGFPTFKTGHNLRNAAIKRCDREK